MSSTWGQHAAHRVIGGSEPLFMVSSSNLFSSCSLLHMHANASNCPKPQKAMSIYSGSQYWQHMKNSSLTTMISMDCSSQTMWWRIFVRLWMHCGQNWLQALAIVYTYQHCSLILVSILCHHCSISLTMLLCRLHQKLDLHMKKPESYQCLYYFTYPSDPYSTYKCYCCKPFSAKYSGQWPTQYLPPQHNAGLHHHQEVSHQHIASRNTWEHLLSNFWPAWNPSKYCRWVLPSVCYLCLTRATVSVYTGYHSSGLLEKASKTRICFNFSSKSPSLHHDERNAHHSVLQILGLKPCSLVPNLMADECTVSNFMKINTADQAHQKASTIVNMTKIKQHIHCPEIPVCLYLLYR